MNDQDVLRLDLPATNRYLGVLSACIVEMLRRVESLNDPQTVAYGIQLAAHEVCANIVEHAYAGCTEGRIRVRLAILTQPLRFIVDLSDSGRAFDPPAPVLVRDDLQERGRGLLLVHQLMDEVSYRRLPDGNSWQLVKVL